MNADPCVQQKIATGTVSVRGQHELVAAYLSTCGLKHDTI